MNVVLFFAKIYANWVIKAELDGWVLFTLKTN